MAENSMSRTLVVGLGGAGMNISRCAQEKVACRVLAVDTDANALRQSGFNWQLLIGPAVCQGGRANVPARGRRAAEESRSLLGEALVGVETLVLIAGLGGGTGTGAAPVITDLAQAMGLRVIVAAVLPFEFEADRREIASSSLPELRSKQATVLVYDNARALSDLGNTNTALPEMFDGVGRGIVADIGAKLSQA